MSKFNTHVGSNDYLMKVNNLSVGLNMPAALKSQGSGDSEVAQGLPPYAPRQAFLVDAYPACPKHWMRSSGRTKSYFVPVKENHGLWLDFNQILSDIVQDVGIVVSIQGVNAISGLRSENAALEQYIDKCPKHNIEFGPDRFCPKCNYKWFKQNYIASAGTPPGSLWLDGFRSEDGVIRQYVFTDKECRSVAKAVIGNDRVFALGISFFLSKQNRPKPPVTQLRPFSAFSQGGLGNLYHISRCASPISLQSMSPCNDHTDYYEVGNISDSIHYKGEITTSSAFLGGDKGMSSAINTYATDAFIKSLGDPKAQVKCFSSQEASWQVGLQSMARERRIAAIKTKNLEIAAGAKINQKIWDDPQNLDYYNNEPAGIIVVNYVPETDAEAIIAAGKIDIEGSKEGFLQDIPVGN